MEGKRPGGEVGSSVDRTGAASYVSTMSLLPIITLPDHSQKFTGQIINPQAGDVLVLTEENNRYFLQKKSLKFFMTD